MKERKINKKENKISKKKAECSEKLSKHNRDDFRELSQQRKGNKNEKRTLNKGQPIVFKGNYRVAAKSKQSKIQWQEEPK